MESVQRILDHPQFKKYMELNSQAEKDRKFCRHDIQHSLDVARVAYIIALENKYNLDKEIIYITALLHDIAKWKQYRQKADHATEGAVLAQEILVDLNLSKDDVAMILDAIAKHRKKEGHSTPLSKVLYAGDKSCRQCVNCNMVEECNWFMNGSTPVLNY